MLNGHGDDIYACTQPIVSNFSSNVYGKQDLSALEAHLCSRMAIIHSYPEPDARSLTEQLALFHGIQAENTGVVNGATEAVYLIAQTFGGSRSAIVTPTFSEYADACTLHGHTVSFCSNLEEMDEQAQLVWLCNPNNPNGKVYDTEYLCEIIAQNTDKLFVIDQSYEYFTHEPVYQPADAIEYKNVILLHSMTKKYAIPGLRLGYFTAHTDWVRAISKHRMPWSVNALAVEAGKFLLTQSPGNLDIDGYLKESVRLQNTLKQIAGLTVFPSKTHFFLCRLCNKTAFELKQWLIENHGILIRDASNFRGLDDRFFRIATQSPDENDALVKAISEWI